MGGTGQMGAEPPHAGLDQSHEPVECDSVAGGGRCGASVEVVHRDQSARSVGNFASCPRHMSDMDCAAVPELLSAQLDQETATEEEAIANAHLGRCEQCQAW